MMNLRVNDCGVSGLYCGWMMEIMKLIDENGMDFGFGRWFLAGGFGEEEWFCREREEMDDFWSSVCWKNEECEPPN
jgi:hypothetical protein